MTYLGPKAFSTTPLTSSNLSTLDNQEMDNPLSIKVRGRHHINLQQGEDQNSIQGHGQAHDWKPTFNFNYKPNDHSSILSSPSSSSSSSSSSSLGLIAGSGSGSELVGSNLISPTKLKQQQSTSSSLSSILSIGTATDSTATSIMIGDDENVDKTQSKNKIFSHTNSQSHSLAQPHLQINNPHVDTSPHFDDDNKTIVDDGKTIIMSRPSSSDSLDKSLFHPLLRKKSGELVKSSLKLNQYLHRSNSMPNAKTVKFADNLENVKYFDKYQRPAAVSTPPTDWDISDLDFEEEGEEEDDETDSLFGNDDDDDFPQRWEILNNDCPHNPLSLNFARLNSNKEVILESLKLNSSKTALIGFAFVQNLSFHKQLIIRLTYDNWSSFIEIANANYISSNHIFKYSDSSSQSYDKFSFIIKLDLLTTFSNFLDIQFCLQFITNNTSYWDNNNGKNYSVSLKKLDKPSSSKSLNNDHSIFDLDDLNIKLKNNNNFVESFSSPSINNNSIIPRSFTIKKVNSDSCLTNMRDRYFIYPSVENTTTNKSQRLTTFNRNTKSAMASPLLSFSTGHFNDPPSNSQLQKHSSNCKPEYSPSDYRKLVENCCFYGSHSPPATKMDTPSLISNGVATSSFSLNC